MHDLSELANLSNRMKIQHQSGLKPDPKHLTVRNLLDLFGYERRQRRVVTQMRDKMNELNLRTVPDFEFAFIDSKVKLEFAQPQPDDAAASNSLDNSIVRIGSLVPANQTPTTIEPDGSLSVATTLMHLYDYSQLPVIANSRDVEGVISWKSIAIQLALGQQFKVVKDCIAPAVVVGINDPILDAIRDILEHGYVLVRGDDRAITGIVTESDIAHQFMQLGGPFLAIGEIEGYLRRLVHRKFLDVELEKVCLDLDSHLGGGGSATLTLRDYCRLLQDPDHWSRLKLSIDRVTFIEHLDAVRTIRNEVMHFNPDGLDPEEEAKLHTVVTLFRRLARMGAF